MVYSKECAQVVAFLVWVIAVPVREVRVPMWAVVSAWELKYVFGPAQGKNTKIALLRSGNQKKYSKINGLAPLGKFPRSTRGIFQQSMWMR